jgi:hypothetical protein
MNFAQGYLLGRPVPIDELEGQSLAIVRSTRPIAARYGCICMS